MIDCGRPAVAYVTANVGRDSACHLQSTYAAQNYASQIPAAFPQSITNHVLALKHPPIQYFQLYPQNLVNLCLHKPCIAMFGNLIYYYYNYK